MVLEKNEIVSHFSLSAIHQSLKLLQADSIRLLKNLTVSFSAQTDHETMGHDENTIHRRESGNSPANKRFRDSAEGRQVVLQSP